MKKLIFALLLLLSLYSSNSSAHGRENVDWLEMLGGAVIGSMIRPNYDYYPQPLYYQPQPIYYPQQQYYIQPPQPYYYPQHRPHYPQQPWYYGR